MTVRSFATFDAPSTAGHSRQDDKSQAGGDLMDYLMQQLHARGLDASPVRPHDSYGWYTEIPVEGGVTWVMLQPSDNWLLITRPIVPLLKRLFVGMRESEHRRVCEALHDTLRGDSRFKNVRWYTPDEFQGRGQGSPEP